MSTESRRAPRFVTRAVAWSVIVLALLASSAGVGAEIAVDSLKIAPGVAAAAGYETPATSYVVANGTPIYNDHVVYGSIAAGQLKRGEKVDALAKVKGWDWLLVGKQGIGIGYVPISMLTPEDKYVP